MLSTFILSNILTPLSYANLEDDLLSKPEQENIEPQTINNSKWWINNTGEDLSNDTDNNQNIDLEKSINPETEDSEPTSKDIDDNIEEVNTKNLMKLGNNAPILRAVTSNDGCYTFDTDTQTITAYNCTGTNIEIPSEIDWVEVKIIWWWSNTTDWAFYNKWLTSIILPDTVTTIKQNAFTKNNLNVVYFGNSITSIERYGFFANASNPVIGIVPKDTSLVSNHNQSYITLVRWYKVIYKDWDDTYETLVTTWIVENLPWTKEWYELVWWYTDSDLSTPFDFTQSITADTILYGKWYKIYNDGCYTFNEWTQTITAYNASCGTDIVIPSSLDNVEVKIIWWWSNTTDWAFYNKWLTSIILPDTVTTIKQNAFTKNNLNVVYFGNSITSIERYGFFANASNPVIGIVPKDTSLVSNHNQSYITLVRWYKVIYKDWDDTYETLVTTWIVENLPWTKEWYELVWWYTDSDLSTPFDFTQSITADTILYGKWYKIYNDGCYTFNEWTQTITNYNASCDTEIEIPSSLDNVEVKIIWENAFNWKWIVSVKIPDTVTDIQDRAFQWVWSNKTLNTVTLWNNVKSIWRYAFASSNLATIILPDSLESTSNDTFFNNEWEWWKVLWIVTKDISQVPAWIRVWTYLVLERWYNVTYIDSWVTLKTVVTTWIVEDYLLDTKEWYLFDAWYKDQSYTEKFDFSNTQTNPITEDTNLYAKWDEIVRTDDWCYEFNKDKKTIIWFGWTWTCGTDIEIPSQIDGVTVEIIWWWALNRSGAFFNKWLTSVKFPDSVKEIQDRAFLQNNLNYVSLWNSIKKIWISAFQDNKLTTIYIPKSVTDIWNWAFSWNTVADIPCATHLSGYWFWVVWVYLSGNDSHLFSKDTCLQFQQWYSVKYMDWNLLYREDVSTWSVKNIELTWKDYYDFSGWYLDNTFSSKFDFSTTITWNTTLFAYWDPIIYHITYELDGWINNPGNPYTYTIESDNINLKAPTKSRYSFVWWTNIDITIPTMSITIIWWSTGDKSYIANWELNGYSWRWRISLNNWNKEHSVSSDDNDINDNEDKNDKNKEKSDSNFDWKYDQELLDAYNRAIKQWLMNSSFDDLLNEWELTRAELAKIAVKYVQILWMEKKLNENVSYPDVDSSLWELENYIKLAYQYQIMWIHADGSKLTYFKPNKFVSRWEFATVFSRILHGFEYNINWSNFYEKHLEILKSEWILKDTNPTRIEEKKWVILMMYRYQNHN